MAQALAHVAASWNVPPWAESSEPDEEAVIHSRHVGALTDLDDGELAVELVQRDELRLTAAGATIVREAPWIRALGVRIGLDKALGLALMLLSAKETAERAEPPRAGLASVEPAEAERPPAEPRREPTSVTLTFLPWKSLRGMALEGLRNGR